MHDKCMAVKTITIDLQAYEMLKRYKREGQSFSQVIKEQLAAPKTGRDLRASLERLALADEAVEAIDRLVERRREDPARPIEL